MMLALLCTSLSLASGLGCGYGPARVVFPGGWKNVHVVEPHPGPTDQPRLSQMLATELCRQLSRLGIHASTVKGATDTTVLYTRLLALTPLAPIIDPRQKQVIMSGLALRLELRLADRAGKTLWRSGILEIDQRYPLGTAGSRESVKIQNYALRHLSIRAARQAIALLTSGL